MFDLREKDEGHHPSLDRLCKLPDETLMAHLQQGEGDALRVLFDRYHRLVLHISMRILRDSGEGEDAMQSVFMEIFQHAGQFDPSRGTAKMWILRIAYHRAINRRKQLMRLQYESGTELDGVDESLPSTVTSVAVSQEARELIAQGFKQVKPVERRVIGLVYFHGWTLKEIAEETGESFSNIRHHYYRGLNKIRRFLGESQEEQHSRVAAKAISDAEA